MTEPARRVATYEDVLASPQHVVAELIEGVLYQSPRPATRHTRVASVGPNYRIIDRAEGDVPRRLRPFDAIEFDVAALWAR